MVKVAVETLGCKVNQYESAGMAETLREHGFDLVPFDAEADVYIINSCSVTRKADYQSRQLIRRATKSNARAQILVTGCYAQVLPAEVAALPGVTLVAGNAEKKDILQLIGEMTGGEKKTLTSDMRSVQEFSTLSPAAFPERTRALLKIQDGCDTFCTYCVVPYARGKSRSLPESQVLERIETLGKAGYRELVLTGINLGAYGRDLDPASDLAALLRRLEEVTTLPRLRLSSLEPQEITDSLLALIRDGESICRHFHIPLQSGDDRILSRMGRNYDAAFFRGLVAKILSYLPDAAVGIDIMVGFPGEGDEEFANTKRLLEELPVAYLHVFPFSPRLGTPAASLPQQVEESEKKRRGLIMRQLGKEKRAAFAEKFLGRELPVLLETGRDRAAAGMQGFSHNYIKVAVKNGDASLTNTLVRVRAEERQEGKLIGRIVDR